MQLNNTNDLESHNQTASLFHVNCQSDSSPGGHHRTDKPSRTIDESWTQKLVQFWRCSEPDSFISYPVFISLTVSLKVHGKTCSTESFFGCRIEPFLPFG